MIPVINQPNPNDPTKAYLKSPTVLIRGILSILMAIGMTGMGVAVYQIADPFTRMVSNNYKDDIKNVEIGCTALMVFCIIFAVFALVRAIGYILTYLSSGKPDQQPQTGLTILHVVAVIEIVYSVFSNWFGLIRTIPYMLHIAVMKKNNRNSSHELTGVKAFGVISILSMIVNLPVLLGAFVLVALHGSYYDLIDTTKSDGKRAAAFFTNDCTVLFIFLLIVAAVMIAIRLIDAIIAFGYANKMKQEFDKAPTPPASTYYQQPYTAPQQPHTANPYQQPYTPPQQPYTANPYQQPYMPPQQNPYQDDEKTVAANQPPRE